MNSNRISRAQLSRLSTKQLRNAAEAHKNEIERLRFSNGKYIDEIRKGHEERVEIKRHENNAEINREIERKEIQLQEIQNHLKRASEQSEGELNRIKTSHRSALVNEKDQFETKAERIRFHQDEQIKDQIQDGELQIQRVRAGIKNDKQQVINELRKEQGQEIQEHSKHKNQLVQKQFTEKRLMQKAYKDDLLQVNREQKKYLRSKLNEHKKLMTDAQRKHNFESQSQQQHFKNRIEDLKNHENTNYTKYYEKSEKEFQNLRGKQNKILEQMRNEITEQHTVNKRKSIDPFYDFGKLNPNIIDDGKKIVLELDIPEFMVKDISVTSEENYIKLNMTRRNGQDIVNEDGVRNKMSKYETYSSKIPTNDRIDPKSMLKVYEEGTLSITHFYKS